MHVVSRSKIKKFYAIHHDAETALERWYELVKKTDYSSFAQVKKSFSSADQVGNFTVFNICGNKYRLIAAIKYNCGKIYIRDIMTHDEYDKNLWKNDEGFKKQ